MVEPDQTGNEAATDRDEPGDGGQVMYAELPALVLRDFTFRLRPQFGPEGAVEGIALDLLPKVGLPLQITTMFERGEFVNMATAGLAGLDVADEISGRPARENGPDDTDERG